MSQIAAKLYQRLSSFFLEFLEFLGAIFRKIRKRKSFEKFDLFFEKNRSNSNTLSLLLMHGGVALDI
jgi:hypothetical protein